MNRAYALDETEPHFLGSSGSPARRPEPNAADAPLGLLVDPGGAQAVVTRSDSFLGRHSSCALRLNAPDVSRHHCRLVFQAGRWWLLDHGSLNGVLVNGRRVRAHALRHGDQIRIGPFSLTVDLSGSTASHPAGERRVFASIAAMLGGPDTRPGAA